MTPSDGRVTHTTKEGIQRLTEFWLYAVLKASSDLGAAGVLLRRIEEEAVSKFLGHEHIDLGSTSDPEEAIHRYMEALDRRGMMDADAIVTRRERDAVHVEIGLACPYRTVCEWAESEHRLRRCFRATAFSEVLRRTTGRLYEERLDSFGVPCRITMSPSRLEVR